MVKCLFCLKYWISEAHLFPSKMHKYPQSTSIRPTCRYSPEFRGLIYKINPHDISCMYKSMFEMCATNNLRAYDEDDIGDLHDVTKTKHVDDKATNIKEKKESEFVGWQVCEDSDLTQNVGTARLLSAGCRQVHASSSKTRSHSAFAKLEYHSIRDDRIKMPNKVPISCRKTYSTEAVGYRQNENRLMSPRLSASGLNDIPFEFKHHGRSHDYIDQYRENYTYKKLKLLRSSANDYTCRSYPVAMAAPPTCQSTSLYPSRVSLFSTTSVPVLGCFDVFGSVKDIAASSNNVQHKQKTHEKKKFWKSQKTPLEAPKVISYDHNCVKKEVNRNLRILAPGRCSSSPTAVVPPATYCQRGSSAAKIRPVCRSRPTIPNSSRCTSSDPPTYVVTYQKNQSRNK